MESVNEERVLALRAQAIELEKAKKYVAESLASLKAISLLTGEEEEEEKGERQQSANDGEIVSSLNEGDDGVGDRRRKFRQRVILPLFPVFPKNSEKGQR